MKLRLGAVLAPGLGAIAIGSDQSGLGGHG